MEVHRNENEHCKKWENESSLLRAEPQPVIGAGFAGSEPTGAHGEVNVLVENCDYAFHVGKVAETAAWGQGDGGRVRGQGWRR